MSHLALHFLGVPLIERDGVPLQLVRHKAVALLAYLAVTKRRHARQDVASLFWPDGDVTKRAGSLRSALWELNRGLGDDWIDADRVSLGLRAGTSLWVDVERFEQLLDPLRAREVSPALTPIAANLARTIEGVSIYRGDFLQGLTLRDSQELVQWQSSQAERFRRRIVQELDRLVTDLIEIGEIAPAIPHAERLTLLDPLNEVAHCRLIQLYARSGRRVDALRQYEACAALLHDELGVAPAEQTRRLYEAIKTNRASTGFLVDVEMKPPPASLLASSSVVLSARADLPAPLTSFVGRESELSLIAQRLDDPSCRIMTLTGPGGSGKTSLALEIAHRRLPFFRDGARFIPLAAVGSPELVAGAIADALDLPSSGDGPIAPRIGEYLRGQHLLLVFDNFEHLLGAAALLSPILTQAPAVRILVTSRERLHVRGECELVVEGLPVAAPGGRGDLRKDAVELFAQAAFRVDASFTLTAENEPIVARICRLLGGMPLAIELAAAWVRQLSLAEIEAQIAVDLDFLVAPRDAPLRQQSMRVMFTHTWSLLTTEEQRVLRRLSVFRGRFTSEAAAAVASSSLPVLAALTNKFLLRRDPSKRYELHELIRQYAAEALDAFPEEHDRACSLHADYYAARIERLRPELEGVRQGTVVLAIESELDNVRAALRWSLGRGHLAPMAQALDGLCLAQEMLGHFHEAEAMLGEHVAVARRACPTERLLLGRLLAWQGHFAIEIAALPLASVLLEESVRILGAQGARAELGFALNASGKLAFAQGNHVGARWCFRGSLAIARAEHDRRAFAEVLRELSDVAFHQGRAAKAERLLVKSLAIFRDLEDRRNVAASLGRVGFLLVFQEKLEEAEKACREGLRVLRGVGDPPRTAALLLELGRVLLLRGDLDGARATYDDALRAGREMNHLETTAAALHGLALLSRQLKNLTDARAFLEESLTLRRRLRARRGIAECLVELGTLDVEAGNLKRARSSFLAALDVATEAGATAVVLDAVLGLIELRDPLERGAPLRKVLETIARHPAAEPSTRTRAALFLGAPAHWKPLTATPPLATLIAAVLLHA